MDVKVSTKLINTKAVETLIHHIQKLPKRDFTPASDHKFCIVTSLAAENGFQTLKNPEEIAIFGAMKSLKVGPRTAHYGWRLYKQYKLTGHWDLGSISY